MLYKPSNDPTTYKQERLNRKEGKRQISRPGNDQNNSIKRTEKREVSLNVCDLEPLIAKSSSR